MPGLLDYIIQDYQNGGAVRHDDLGWAGSGSFLGTETADPFTTFSSNPFDPSALPTQSDILGQYDIELTDDKFKPFIPTYDQTGEGFLRTNYMQDRQGLYAGGRSALGQLGQKSSQTSAQQGFAGMGKSLLDTTRGDIVDEFGRQSQKAWTGLQQDIYGRRKDYERDVLGALGDLEPDAYTIDEGDDESLQDCIDNCNDTKTGGVLENCLAACEGGDDGCNDGYYDCNGECIPDDVSCDG